ncbi:hypothetical protein C8N46_102275 [Kordia periserrulae]|uniref:Uncharacterized protein n=1 Tax=Kordia periserrulae TaxID=701523 RepID=A0A2T6C3J2_9FLAO|nr:hypothetical protein [Kordia periserrulae]PTX62875.1 hypothetical protein C8N46_102275 [Kordia periserrulae]
MKKVYVLMLLIITIISCSKESEQSLNPEDQSLFETVNPDAKAAFYLDGKLQEGEYAIDENHKYVIYSGNTVKVYTSETTLQKSNTDFTKIKDIIKAAKKATPTGIQQMEDLATARKRIERFIDNARANPVQEKVLDDPHLLENHADDLAIHMRGNIYGEKYYVKTQVNQTTPTGGLVGVYGVLDLESEVLLAPTTNASLYLGLPETTEITMVNHGLASKGALLTTGADYTGTAVFFDNLSPGEEIDFSVANWTNVVSVYVY